MIMIMIVMMTMVEYVCVHRPDIGNGVRTHVNSKGTEKEKDQAQAEKPTKGKC